MFGFGFLFYAVFGLTLFFVLFCVKNLKDRRHAKAKRYPRGPLGLPVIGNLHQLGREPFKSFMEIGKKYGDIFSFEFGSQKAVVLNNHEDIREAFGMLHMSGRVISEDLLMHCDGAPRGLVLNFGPSWMEHRRFVLRTLRDFGFGKTSTEEIIRTEVIELIDTMAEKVGQPILLAEWIYPHVSNAIWTMMSGMRTPCNDPSLLSLLDALETMARTAVQVSLTVFFPWLRRFLKMLPKSSAKRDKETQGQIKAFMEKVIQDSMTDQSEEDNAEPKSFVDAYLKEIKKTTDPTSSFYGEEGMKNLKTVLFDLFAAGTETTSSTIVWICIFLGMYPKVQEKVHEEIRKVIGLERLPSLKDRLEYAMPYTDAVIAEVTRFVTLLPLSVPHATTEDTFFKGYLIPKGTMLIPNLHGAHHDPKVWGDPETFRPERFLSPDGKTFVKHEALIPFSSGRRICIGIGLAQDELFLYMTSIFQRFRLGPVPNGESLRIEYTIAVALVSLPQHLMLHDRLTD